MSPNPPDMNQTPEDQDEGKYQKALKDIASYSHIGITFAVTILVFIFGGQYLDKKLDTDPYLTLIGAFLGAGLGFYYIIKELNRPEEK
mgnify:CR=1 FL=1